MNDYLFRVQELLQPGGPMETDLEGFTYRAEQMRFAQAVAQAFQDETFLAAEAGTGVGKTYGYLIPALLWAQEHQVKIVVATKTKALQQQIVDRDLPGLEKVLKNKFEYVEAKGRENYVCWNKYQKILAGRKQLAAGEIDFIQSILSWAEMTKSGDKKELTLEQSKMKYWPIIAADRHSCLRDMCRYRDKCFRLKMIKSMGKAHLIVTNHALLLSDVLVDNSILPEFHHLIIDEAHNFMKESFDRLACRFSLYDTINLLESLYVKDRHSKRGYLFHLRSGWSHLGPVLDETGWLVDQLLTLTHDLFGYWAQGLRKGEGNSNLVLSEEDLEKESFIQSIELYGQEWKPAMNRLLGRLKDLYQELEGSPEGEELGGILMALETIDETAFAIMNEELNPDNNLLWLELGPAGGSEFLEAVPEKVTALCSSRIDNWDRLNHKLYEKLDTLVMVSATLAVEERFDNFIERSGLLTYDQTGRMQTFLEQSPFDYQQQACLCVVEDMAAPNSPHFGREVINVLADIFRHRGGQTMVLFTSLKQLREAAHLLRPLCERQGLRLLVQHEDGEFASLIDEFIKQENAILMGVETFWEGIDLKGEVLKCLVIVKLPFRSPADPYCSAWGRYFEIRHQNSFKYFMLPDAVVRFKQGVGRLIRSETDRGIVVVLDTRINQSRYGAAFKNSIPIKNLFSLPRAELGNHMQNW